MTCIFILLCQGKTESNCVNPVFYSSLSRWFCSEWKDLCTKGAVSPSTEPRAPLERRSLYNPKSSAPQGTLTMWLDILSAEDAKKYPVKNITPPPSEEWEVSMDVLLCLVFCVGENLGRGVVKLRSLLLSNVFLCYFIQKF